MQKQLDGRIKRFIGPFEAYQVVVWLIFLAGGGYFPWQWGLAVLVGLAVLIWQMTEAGGLYLPGGSVELVCTGIMIGGAVISLFTSVDRGAGREGILRLFVYLFFVFLLIQWNAEQRKRLCSMLPYIGSVMVLVCIAGWFFPSVRVLYWSNGRMTGFFQYANTFALFLLLGLITGKQRTGWHHLIQVILLFGIAASGSRWTMILLMIWVVWMLIRKKLDKPFIITLVLSGLGGLILAIVLRGWTFLRFTDSQAFSTVWGRLLYWQDAITVLFEHPAGIGYLGWFYLQGSIQTGVYNVRFVHNELIQLALDYGLAVAAAAVFLVIWRLRKKCLAPEIAVVICLHSMADPDLQFYGIFLFLALALSSVEECHRVVSVQVVKNLVVSVMAVIAVLAVHCGAADFALQCGYSSIALRMSPYDTEAAIQRMLEKNSLEEAVADAHRILSNNSYSSIAWQIIAENALKQGNYESMASAQRQTVKMRKYEQNIYDDSIFRLSQAVAEGWSVENAMTEIIWITNYQSEVLKTTSLLGWKIADQPELLFSDEALLCIQAIQQLVEMK